MIIKQIIFQQPEANGYVSTAEDKKSLINHTQLAYPIKDLSLENNEAKIFNIYENILADQEICDKLGIIAPPGTKFELTDNSNNPKLISIGATGLYELEGIKLTGIKAIPILQYTYNADLTNKYLDDGKNGLIEALQKFNNTLQNNNISTGEINQQNLDNIHQDLLEFEEEYTNKYTIYQVGLNGVYETNADKFLPQTSIIIDYRVQGGINK